jgi:hypothetical protein
MFIGQREHLPPRKLSANFLLVRDFSIPRLLWHRLQVLHMRG